MYNELISKERTLCVIGLGYVGLPIALAFSRHVRVIGFDISAERIAMMQRGEDPSDELPPEAFEGADITFTANPDELREASFFVIAVPTPVDDHRVPDLTPLTKASETLAKVLKPGDYAVYESTVYPGCTEEDCLPILEQGSGLRLGKDFKLGYSPERINPGDAVHTLSNVIKVVSGSDAEALEEIAKTYELVVEAGVHRAPSIKVAEAAKIIENTQRDLNIALMNELSKIFDQMDINTYDVLEAAGTKWNFLGFSPGLVGGHCIGVDPYYLTYKSMELGYTPQIILSGRRVNDAMAAYVGRRTIQHILAAGVELQKARILVMGATFKENVSDIRNSKVADVVRTLQEYQLEVDVVDPHAHPEQVEAEYGYTLAPAIRDSYDAIIVAVNHDDYANKDESWFQGILNPGGIVVDVKGIYRNRLPNLRYWSL